MLISLQAMQYHLEIFDIINNEHEELIHELFRSLVGGSEMSLIFFYIVEDVSAWRIVTDASEVVKSVPVTDKSDLEDRRT